MAKDQRGGVTLAMNVASTAGLAYTVGVAVGRGGISLLVFLALMLATAAVTYSWFRFIVASRRQQAERTQHKLIGEQDIWPRT